MNIKILFLTQLFPYPLDSGGQIKSYHFIKALSEHYEIILISFIRSDKEKEYFCHLDFCKRIEVCSIKRSTAKNIYDALKSIFKNESFIISRDFIPEMQDIINNLIKAENPDFIHIDHLQMYQYIKENKKGISLLDEHNVEYFIIKRIFQTERNILKKLFACLEYRKLKKYETKAIMNSDITLAVSEIDRKEFISLTNKQGAIKAIPIGVDTDYFCYETFTGNSEKTVVFIGSLYWPPNIEAVNWFYKNVWPDIKNKSKGLKWKIIGLKPAKEILALNEADKSIEIFGNAKDVRPFMKGEGVFIVPLFSGSGVRVKILNALACGIPVISTTIGAEGIEGLNPVTFKNIDPGASNQNPRANFNIWIADKPEEFSDAIITLIQNKDLREKISRNGRKLMEEKYSWEIQGSKLLKVYEEIKPGPLSQIPGAF